MPTPSTREELYEYRIANVVRHFLLDMSDIAAKDYKTGEELEIFLRNNKRNFADAIFYDIEVWMGFDDLLKQVQNG